MTTAQRSRAAGASVLVQRRLDRLQAWSAHHRREAVQSLVDLLRNWMSSAMTWLVIGIALALPVILYLILTNVGSVSETWEGKPRLSLYLADSVSEADGRAVARALEAREGIAQTRYISPEQALEEFKTMSGFGEAAESLDDNPLPPVIVLVPGVGEPARLRLLVAELEGREDVASVSVDLEWIERLYAILNFGERLVAALGLFLGLGVLLIIGNTIRLAIENRREEIEVVKLVGGTNAFVRRPFLYMGLWYGLGGAVIAWLLVHVSLAFLASPVEQLARSYGNRFEIAGLSGPETLILCLGGAVLGIAGALLAVGRHLHRIEPR